MSKLSRYLVTIELVVCFGLPFYLWFLGVFFVFADQDFPRLLFMGDTIGFITLPIFITPAVFGAAGAWGVFVLYLNAVFGYKAFDSFKSPIVCGALGVFAISFAVVIFEVLYSPLILILSCGCFAHLVWLNKMALVSNGT